MVVGLLVVMVLLVALVRVRGLITLHPRALVVVGPLVVGVGLLGVVVHLKEAWAGLLGVVDLL